jgi:hypothetical protein
MVSGSAGQTHYSYQYSYYPQSYQSSLINAVSDTFTINQDLNWFGGPDDDQYYTLGMLIGPNTGSNQGAIPLNINLTISYTATVPSVSFTALYDSVVQNSFAMPIFLGHQYKREIIISNNAGSGSIGGDSSDPGGTITYNITDLTAGTGTETFTFAFPIGYRFVEAFDGSEWWTFSTYPWELEYDVAITNYGFSNDGGVTYYQFQGSDLSVISDGSYPADQYPMDRLHLVVPGAPVAKHSSFASSTATVKTLVAISVSRDNITNVVLNDFDMVAILSHEIIESATNAAADTSDKKGYTVGDGTNLLEVCDMCAAVTYSTTNADGLAVAQYFDKVTKKCVSPGGTTGPLNPSPNKTYTTFNSGGATITNPVICVLFWGPTWGSNSAVSTRVVYLIRDLLLGSDSQYWSTLTTDYGINTPTFGGSGFNSGSPPSSSNVFTIADVERALKDAINNGQIQSPASNFQSSNTYSNIIYCVIPDLSWKLSNKEKLYPWFGIHQVLSVTASTAGTPPPPPPPSTGGSQNYFNWYYATTGTLPSGTNAVTDKIKINNDVGSTRPFGGEEYWLFGIQFSDGTQYLLDLFINDTTPDGTFWLLQTDRGSKTVINSFNFTQPIVVGHTYKREMKWTSTKITIFLTDITANTPVQSASSNIPNGIGTPSFIFDGLAWYDPSATGPWTPRYDVTVTTWSDSTNNGTNYTALTGSNLTVVTDQQYTGTYPVSGFHLTATGTLPSTPPPPPGPAPGPSPPPPAGTTNHYWSGLSPNWSAASSAVGVSDTITLNTDLGFNQAPAASINIFMLEYFAGSDDAIFELDLYCYGDSSSSFVALFNGSIRHTFTASPTAGHSYLRQISQTTSTNVRFTLRDITANTAAENYDYPVLQVRNGVALFNGIDWRDNSVSGNAVTAPFPVRYKATISNFGWI